MVVFRRKQQRDGSERCFYDHDCKVDVAALTQASLLRPFNKQQIKEFRQKTRPENSATRATPQASLDSLCV